MLFSLLSALVSEFSAVSLAQGLSPHSSRQNQFNLPGNCSLTESTDIDKKTQNPGGYHEVFKLALPVIVTMVSQTVMWFLDTAMVGRLGKESLAAVGISGIYVWAFLSFFNGTLNSVNTFVAQSYGGRRYEEIGGITWQGFYLAVISYVIVLLAAPLLQFALKLVGLSPEVYGLGSTYARIRLYSGFFVFITMTTSSFLRGIGNTTTPMLIAIVANTVNAVGDYLLIFGKFGFPRLGVAGAAIATFVASVVSAILYLIVFLSRQNAQRFNTRSAFRFVWKNVWRLLRIGLPIGLLWLLDMGSFAVFSSVIGHIDETFLAAHQAAITLMSTSFMPLSGLSAAATILVGQYIGAGKNQDARKSGYTAIKMSLVYCFVIAILFCTIPRLLISIISQDAIVIQQGAKLLMMAALFQLSDGLGICSGGALRGAGDTRFPMIVGVVYSWGFFVPVSFLVGVVLKVGVLSTWVVATAYIIAYGVTLFLRFRGSKWETISI